MGLRDWLNGIREMVGDIVSGARTSDPEQERLVSERRGPADRLLGRWGNGPAPFPTNVDQQVEGHQSWTDDGAPLVTTPVDHPSIPHEDPAEPPGR